MINDQNLKGELSEQRTSEYVMVLKHTKVTDRFRLADRPSASWIVQSTDAAISKTESQMRHEIYVPLLDNTCIEWLRQKCLSPLLLWV